MKISLKTVCQFLTVMTLIVIFTHLSVFAGDYSSLPISDGAKDILTGSQIPTPPDKTGQEIAKDLVLGGLRYVKIVTVVVGILYITIMGYTLVTHGDNEEEVTKAKRGLTYTIIAFIMISISQEFSRIFDMEGGKTLLGSPQEIIKRVRFFDKQVEIVMTFIKYTIATYATLMVVRSGIKLVTAGGKEEETTKHKKSILYSAGGLILIYVGDIFINKVFYKVDKNVYSGITGVHPKVDAKAGVEQIVGITNFIVSFIGPIAILMLIVGAIMYATAGGEDEKMQKAKRLLVATAFGIILIYGSFAMVSTVLTGRLENLGTLTE